MAGDSEQTHHELAVDEFQQIRWSDVMRSLAMTLVLCVAMTGCGSDSKTAETASPGIPLSISGPGAAAKPGEADATAAVDKFAPAVAQLLQKANAAVVGGKNTVAIESLSQAIGITPDDASLFRMRADVYALQGENANARADFSTAVRIDPKNPDLYNFRGYFLMAQGMSAEALADFNKAIELNSNHAAALNNRGLMSLTTGDFKAAEADFSRAIDADRKFSDAWNNRGFARMKLEQPAEAMSDIKQAIRLKDNYTTAWNNCGLIAMQMSNFDEAEKAFAKAVELDPMDARWLNHHRAALLKQNRFAEAQKDADRIAWLSDLQLLTQQANRNARNPQAWLARGQHLVNGEQFGAAITDFTRALVVNPGNAEALFNRAGAWVRTGELQKAMLDCDESLVSRPTKEAYSLRGDIWMRLDDLDQAISDFEMAGRFDEEVADAYEKRSAKRKEAGETEAAKEDAARAKELREASINKPDEPKSGSQTAEGFDPNN